MLFSSWCDSILAKWLLTIEEDTTDIVVLFKFDMFFIDKSSGDDEDRSWWWLSVEINEADLGAGFVGQFESCDCFLLLDASRSSALCLIRGDDEDFSVFINDDDDDDKGEDCACFLRDDDVKGLCTGVDCDGGGGNGWGGTNWGNWLLLALAFMYCWNTLK